MKKTSVILLHIAIWLFFILFPLSMLPRGSFSIIIFLPIVNPLNIAFFYFNAHYLFPRIFRKSSFIKYVLSILAYFILQGFIAWLLAISFPETFKSAQEFLKPSPPLPVSYIFPSILVLTASLVYAMYLERKTTAELQRSREKEHLKSELNFLRSQINPHFLFNVLNNLVSLSRKKSDKLEPMLLQLSSLMRYMLYESNSEKVSMQQEITYLKTYIDLQKMRFEKRSEIRFDYYKQTLREHIIEPMLFIPFIENAFKHGFDSMENPEISISLFETDNSISLMVRNKFISLSEENKDAHSGIGLANVKRRLQLIYENQHKLEIQAGDSVYVVNLEIHL